MLNVKSLCDQEKYSSYNACRVKFSGFLDVVEVQFLLLSSCTPIKGLVCRLSTACLSSWFLFQALFPESQTVTSGP